MNLSRLNIPSPLPNRREGMTLIELLAVIAIAALLMTLTISNITGITQGQGMKKALNEVGDLLENARTEAMATSTWVWIGFRDSTQDNAGKQPEVTIVVVASRDGTANQTSSNLVILGKPIRIANVKVLNSLTQWAIAGETVPLADSPNTFTTRVNGTNRQFSKTVLAFSPQGEATLGGTTISPWIEVGLREMRGATEITAKTASIRVSGVSGAQVIDY